MSAEAKCNCQNCSGHVAFPVEMVGQMAECPHCHLETRLFIPPTAAAPPRPKVRKATPELGTQNSNPIRLFFAAALAIAAIIAAPFIWQARHDALVKDMTWAAYGADFKVEHIPRYLQKAQMLKQVNLDIADAARKIRAEQDSSITQSERKLEVDMKRLSNERELLEVRAQNDLAEARTPEERWRIENRLAADKKKNTEEEQETKLKSLIALQKKLREEVGTEAAPGTLAQKLKAITEQPGYFTEEQDNRITAAKAKDRADAEAYMTGTAKDGFSFEKDRELIWSLNEKARLGAAAATQAAQERAAAAREAAVERAKASAERAKANAERALKEDQADAANGEPDGLARMGVRYRDGYGVEKDWGKAEEYLTKAATAGSPHAVRVLAEMKQDATPPPAKP